MADHGHVHDRRHTDGQPFGSRQRQPVAGRLPVAHSGDLRQISHSVGLVPALRGLARRLPQKRGPGLGLPGREIGRTEKSPVLHDGNRGLFVRKFGRGIDESGRDFIQSRRFGEIRPNERKQGDFAEAVRIRIESVLGAGALGLNGRGLFEAAGRILLSMGFGQRVSGRRQGIFLQIAVDERNQRLAQRLRRERVSQDRQLRIGGQMRRGLVREREVHLPGGGQRQVVLRGAAHHFGHHANRLGDEKEQVSEPRRLRNRRRHFERRLRRMQGVDLAQRRVPKGPNGTLEARRRRRKSLGFGPQNSLFLLKRQKSGGIPQNIREVGRGERIFRRGQFYVIPRMRVQFRRRAVQIPPG